MFVWSETCDNCFSKMKEALASALVLAIPETDKPYVMYTEASITGLGCDDAKRSSSAYVSRQL